MLSRSSRVCASVCAVILCGAPLLSSCSDSTEEERPEVLQQRYTSLLAAEQRDTPQDQVVARVGERGVVTRAAFEREWSLHPELSREEVLEVLVRRELLLESFGETEFAEADEELIWAMRLANKRGAADALILSEVVKGAESVGVASSAQFDAFVQGEVDRLSAPVGYDASHLLVRVPDGADETQWQRAKDVAVEIKQRLQKGDPSLLGAMTQYVLDVNGEQGGFELAVNGHLKFPVRFEKDAVLEDGFIQVVAEFSHGAAKLFAEQGAEALSEPVKSPFGWHLIVVHERFESRGPSLKDVRERLLRQQKNQQAQRALIEYIEPLYGRYNWSTDPTALEDELDVSEGGGGEGDQQGEQTE